MPEKDKRRKMNLEFEKRVNLEIKLLGLAVGILTIYCSYHQIFLMN